MAHQYMEIDTDTVWNVVTRDLSNIEAAIDAIARAHFNE
ncbi:HepT-like ribonuclease domain-containing protein [Coleofasciculus sp.]